MNKDSRGNILKMIFSAALDIYYKFTINAVFSGVTLETITECNLRCSYCPNSIYDRGLKKNSKKIEIGLFHAVIDELAEMNWSGRIQPQGYGEPLLDDRLPQLIKYARNKLPKAPIVIFSNGILLSLDKYRELVEAGVTEFHVTQQVKTESIPANIYEIINYRKASPHRNVLFRYVTNTTDNRWNRAGIIKISDDENMEFRTRCLMPSQEIYITYDGNIMFCCQDYLQTCSVSVYNVKNEKLMSIWNKADYRRLRSETRNGIFNLGICRQCAFGHELPPVSGQ